MDTNKSFVPPACSLHLLNRSLARSYLTEPIAHFVSSSRKPLSRHRKSGAVQFKGSDRSKI